MSIPDILLERYALGEVTDDERRAIEADPETPERLRRLREADEAIHRAHDADRFAAQVHARRAEAVGERTARRRAISLAVALAAGALVWALLPAEPDVRAKGADAPQLLLYVDTPRGARLAPPGIRLAAGDAVQLAYLSGGRQHGVIVSLDGSGTVTLHHPRQGTDALDEGEIRLPEAYRLDDAPRFERFFLVADDVPVDVSAVIAAAESLAAAADPELQPLALPQIQADFLVRKP